MRFRNQCFCSKHCQTKYNVNRDKVPCLERIRHHLEAENEAAKVFAIITFQIQFERNSPYKGESNYRTQWMTMWGSAKPWALQNIYYYNRALQAELKEPLTQLSLQPYKHTVIGEWAQKVRDIIPPMGVIEYCKVKTWRFFIFVCLCEKETNLSTREKAILCNVKGKRHPCTFFFGITEFLVPLKCPGYIPSTQFI